MPSFTPFSLNANAEDDRHPLKDLLGAQSPKFLQIAIRQFFQRVFAQPRPKAEIARPDLPWRIKAFARQRTN